MVKNSNKFDFYHSNPCVSEIFFVILHTELCVHILIMNYKIQTYEQIDRDEWNRLVQASATGTWFQTPEAYEFFASMPEMFAPFVFAVTGTHESNSGAMNEETLRGVCAGYVTVERNPIRQFFTRRAVILGGPTLADDATEEEVTTLMSAVKTFLSSKGTVSGCSPIYIETRNFHDYSRWKEAFSKAGFEYRKHLNFHIDCTDKDGMYERMSETRRRQIRKAISSDVKTMEAQSEQEIADWYYILAELYRRKVKTPLFPLSFFIEFYRQKRGVILLVKYGEKVIGGMMCPIFDGKCIYEWFVCGMDNEYKNQYPSVMATWAAMEYATGYTIPMFDIMGAGVPGVPYGVRDFKAEFGGEMVEHGRFLHVAKPWLYKIGTLGVKVLKRI